MPPLTKRLAATLLTLTLTLAHPTHASPFTSFAEDENTCRQAAAAAIQAATGPAAAQRYDRVHQSCMVAHGRRRAWDAMQNAAPDPQPANPHSFDFPDAYYSVPYATPGYGYDGFSY